MTDIHDRVIARLATILASLQDLDPVIERVCEAGRRMLDADGAAIVLSMEEDVLLIACTTDELAATLEDVQVVVGEGPTLASLETGAVTSVDLARDEDVAWPLFHERASGLGFQGVVTVVPLVLEHHTLGVLSVHRHGGDGTDETVYGFLGAALAAALLEDPDSALGTPARRHDGWSSQAKVHQATGMVIAQIGVRPTDAIALLRAQAFSTGASLLDVAEHVIERQIDFRNFTVEGD